MFNSLPKDLTPAQKLIEKYKYDEALQFLLDFEKSKANTFLEKTSCRLLQCQLLIWKGKYEDAINLAERIHKDSLGFGEYISTVDSLILMTDALIWEGNYKKAFEVINQAGDFLNRLSQEEGYIQKQATIANYKGRLYILKKHPDLDLGQELLEYSLKLRKEFGNELDVAKSLLRLGHLLAFRGLEPDRGLKLIMQALSLGKKIGNKYFNAIVKRSLMSFYYEKGDLNLSLKYAEESLAFFYEIDNKSRIAPLLSIIGFIHKLNGEFDITLEYYEQALVISEEIGIESQNPIILSHFIEIYLELGNLELAKQYFKHLEQLNDRVENDWTKYIYRFNKARLLKQSSRIMGLAEAEIMFKEIIEEKGQWTNYALLEMCDLLIIELKMIKNEEVLDEINFYLNKLRIYAENFKAFSLLAETCLIQAKVSLIKLDLKNAKKYLIQGQQIAERQVYQPLIAKFSEEFKDFKEKETIWKNFKISNASISDRVELTKISGYIKQLLRNSTKLTN